MSTNWKAIRVTSRRRFLRDCALGTAVLASGSILGDQTSTVSPWRGGQGPARWTLRLDSHWLFGGKFQDGVQEPDFDDSGFAAVSLPHCVAKLSWQKWNVSDWEALWIYRRHLALPKQFEGMRLFLDFEGVTVGATPFVNGHGLPEHLGGYLPFHYEVTDFVNGKNDVLAVRVDSRWRNAPPEGSPRGPASIDYYVPGGITRPVALRAVPRIFISDLFAKPVSVLDAGRAVEITCTIDADRLPSRPLRLRADLWDGDLRLATDSQSVKVERLGETEVRLTLSRLGNITLWDVDRPRLYNVVVTLFANDRPLHAYRTRIGFREARFELDGFYLNGRRFQLFGLDRHELFPYVGSAMPRRVMRHEAAMLRHEFNCNIVRCSHYPQSEAFVEACNELGLMLWEELPGWQYVGGPQWQDLAVRDVRDMVRRDRNHPAIVIWGVRINESANHPDLYRRTKAAAKSLDDSRPTSGAMNRYSTKNWVQEVYAYDDYHTAPDGGVGIRPPLPDVPYFLTEMVGQYGYQKRRGFGNKYRRAGDLALQQHQALWHAQAHSRVGDTPRICGAIAWCAFDYGSRINSHNGVKCPGVADIFRIPKLGASFYQAQADPKHRVVIQPNFYWDFGSQTPSGPGEKAAIFSNCDRLEIFVDGKHRATLHPDHSGYPHLKHPPFFVDLKLDGKGNPELRIEGFLGDSLALSRSFSSDRSQDQFLVQADDAELAGDGTDATRLVFLVGDKYGTPRLLAGGTVSFQIDGPGTIVGDNPFDLAPTGGVGAVWIRSAAAGGGRITIIAKHSSLGKKQATVEVASA